MSVLSGVLPRISFPRFGFLKLVKSHRSFSLTRGGWVFILYTIGVGAGAINTGNNLLYLVFGVFLGLILASGLLSDLTLWNVNVECRFPGSIEAGTMSLLPVRIENGKRRLPSVSVAVEVEAELRGEPLTLRVHVPFLHPLQSDSAFLHILPRRRGRFRVKRILTCSRYPFGLLRKRWLMKTEKEMGPSEEFLVYPASVPVSADVVERLAAGDESPTEKDPRAGDGTMIMSLREYRVGDSPRRIHWKASAKRQRGEDAEPRWLMRETDQEHRREAVLAWPAAETWGRFPAEAVESFVQFSASLFRRLVEDGYRVRLQVPAASGYYSVDASERIDAALGFLALWDAGAPLEIPFRDAFEAQADPDATRRGVELMELFNLDRTSGAGR